jgi:hypothetical protein
MSFAGSDLLTPLSIAAIAASLIAALGGTLILRQHRDRLPTIEVDHTQWGDDLIAVFLIIRNRLAEWLMVEEITAKRPRGTIVRGEDRRAVFAVIARVVARVPPSPDGGGCRFSFWMKPPSGWAGGDIRFELRFSSMNSTLRHKKVKGAGTAFPAAQVGSSPRSRPQ